MKIKYNNGFYEILNNDGSKYEQPIVDMNVYMNGNEPPLVKATLIIEEIELELDDKSFDKTYKDLSGNKYKRIE